MVLRYTSSFDGTLGFSDTCAQLALTSSANLSYTLPGNNTHKYVITFAYNATSNVFVGYNVSPAIPSSGMIKTVARVEFRPIQRYAIGGDVIYFATPDSIVYMGISVRSVPN